MSRSVYVTDLSVEDLARLKALRKECKRPDAHMDREIFRAGLDALEAAKEPEPVTLDATFEVLETSDPVDETSD